MKKASLQTNIYNNNALNLVQAFIDNPKPEAMRAVEEKQLDDYRYPKTRMVSTISPMLKSQMT